MGILTVIFVLSILVIVHEWGHFIAARSVGVRVEEFSVGFGKKLYSKIHKGTEFMIKAVPLGGYVKMSGDDRSKCVGSPEEFYSHPIGHRMVIVVMGPIVNFIFAYLCFFLIFFTGYPKLSSVIARVEDGRPAQVAGLQKGDKIIQINSKQIKSFEDIQSSVKGSKGEPLKFVILRNNAKIFKEIAPEPVKHKNIFGQDSVVMRVGIEPVPDIVLVKYGIGESFVKAGEQLVQIVILTFRALYHVFSGSIPAKDALAGPVRIFGIINDAAAMGIAYVIYIMAIISASLAIFNLFPIPILDGGHLLIFTIEKIRKKPLPLHVEEKMYKAGLGMILCLFVFVLYNDFVELGWLQKIIAFFGSFIK